MDTNDISATATDLVAKAGSTAHRVIGLYRAGGERLADTLEQRWTTALKEAGPKLTPETRKNAARAQHAFTTVYSRGLSLSADGAVAVVDTLVGVTVAAIERTAAFAQANLRKAG